MELLWGNLLVLLHFCNRLNGSPDPKLSAAQEHRESANKEDPGRMVEMAPPATTSSSTLVPWPKRRRSSPSGGSKPFAVMGLHPKTILFQALSLGSREPNTDTAPLGRSARTLQAQVREHGPAKSL